MKLKTKALLIVFIFGLLSGSLVIFLTSRTVDWIIQKNMEKSGASEIAELAQKVSDVYEGGHEARILSILQESKSVLNAAYVEALDIRGRVIAHTNVAEKGHLYTDPDTRSMLAAPHAGSRVLLDNKNLIMLLWAPVWSQKTEEWNEQFLLGGSLSSSSHAQRIGTVRIGLPMRGPMKIGHAIVRDMALIVTATGLLTMLVLFMALNRFLSPIHSLLRGTQEIANGQYGNTVPVLSSDELSDLALSFNRMSTVLAETTVSKNFLGDILSNLSDPLLVTAPDGTIRMVNQAALTVSGYARDELLGKPLSILLSDEGPSAARTPTDRERLGRSAVRNLEIEWLSKSGAKIPVLFSSANFTDQDSHPMGMIVIAKDMTERKKLESVIRQSEKLSAVGQLAAGVAHEINNPLGVILGFSQAVLRRLAPQDALEMPLRSIEREAVRCKNLVQDLLTFSRVSKVDREPVDLNRAVQGALSLVTARAQMAQIEVRQELAAELPKLLGNLNQIQQVIINLANNAVDAMGPRGVLTVKTEASSESPLEWICLKVIDTGPGITPDVQARMFDPFFTTKPVGQGTGLGLSLVHEIIKKHSGTIQVQTHPGHTEFIVKFPIRGLNNPPPSTASAKGTIS